MFLLSHLFFASRFRYIPGKPDQGFNKKKANKRDKFDPQCQEATPEILRIEIEQIFKEFLDNPEKEVYIFPPGLNNLQRKYIHNKAQALNISSKSHGKHPERILHITKKKNQFSNMSFIITPTKPVLECLKDFTDNIQHLEPYKAQHKSNIEKNPYKLWNGVLTVPIDVNPTQEIQEVKSMLPISNYREEIIKTIICNQITIISSETGSGKTTQIPQYILECMNEMNEPCKIICTQPRRISTVAAAERVAYERCEHVGKSVGYHIRLEQKYGIQTNLIYCTTGVFVRNLMSGGKTLKNITHIILDEIHERDKLSDFLLICLKQFLPSNPKIKIILMSATLTAHKFQEYFGTGHILQIPGRQYPISTSYLEDILVSTGYMSPRMRALEAKEEERKIHTEKPEVNKYEDVSVDEALIEYMNFCEDYDYRVHYEEATAQLGMFFLSEGVPVDYQHSTNGRTALMIASHLGDKEFVTRLCNMGKYTIF